MARTAEGGPVFFDEGDPGDETGRLLEMAATALFCLSNTSEARRSISGALTPFLKRSAAGWIFLRGSAAAYPISGFLPAVPNGRPEKADAIFKRALSG